MRDLNHQLKGLCRRNRDGSRSTQAHRERLLSFISNELHTLGYRRMNATSLKPKHVDALVARWQANNLSEGTLKNRMSALRWWAEKINKQNIIARDNSYYGIAPRQLIGDASKAKELTADALDRIKDPYVRMTLELQQAFGLRREEAIKFAPAYADRDDRLILKPSWTKGGRTREIPINTDAQREVLDRAHQLAGKGSLIPSNLRYVDQLRRYEHHVSQAGLSKMHGLRHAYAQQRYETLTGWACPMAGGPTRETLSPEQLDVDRDARLTISQELGHEREQITAVYVGR